MINNKLIQQNVPLKFIQPHAIWWITNTQHVIEWNKWPCYLFCINFLKSFILSYGQHAHHISIKFYLRAVENLLLEKIGKSFTQRVRIILLPVKGKAHNIFYRPFHIQTKLNNNFFLLPYKYITYIILTRLL